MNKYLFLYDCFKYLPSRRFVLCVVFLLTQLSLFFQGWYIVTYALGIYHLNLFIAFLSPKIDPAIIDYEGKYQSYSANLLPQVLTF